MLAGVNDNFLIESEENKLAKLKATLVQNYDWLTEEGEV